MTQQLLRSTHLKKRNSMSGEKAKAQVKKSKL